MTTFDEIDDEPMLYKAYNTYFVTTDKLELKARILNLNEECNMIMINTQDGGLLTQLDSLLSARYITGTTCSVEIEEEDGVRYSLNGCTVEMLAVLLEALAKKDTVKEVKVKDKEVKDNAETDDADDKAEEDSEAEDADINDDDDDLEYDFYEELAELTTKALNLAGHIIGSLKLKLKI